ncbi:mucin-binding protein [Limosilactobacillus coleohominis]|uniref:mucin-binding protein n=1 Tax=Limosilactobacillus coleohominis TaxID=181675 RepID=UPI0012DBCCCF|nr:LPXTG cell wall anchor domain-containing protein [Limosilactobacillus coleohominis]
MTETVNYQDQKGNQLATPHKMTLTFNGTGYRDLVTNQNVISGWKLANGEEDSGSFASVGNPQIKGYHVVAATDDQGNDVLDTTTNQVKAQTGITHTSPDIQVLVTYAADPRPTQPTKPSDPVHPTEPTKPVQPTKPVEPTRPAQPIQPTEPTRPIATEHPKETQPVIVHAQGTLAVTSHQNVVQHDSAQQKNSAAKTKATLNRLPQTGNSNPVAIIGLGIASLFGTLGFASRKRSTK